MTDAGFALANCEQDPKPSRLAEDTEKSGGFLDRRERFHIHICEYIVGAKQDAVL
jgi:hypothetical protein